MKKHHVHTTLSSRHWDLLIKHAEKYETQQKVIEHALECLDHSTTQATPISPEEALWAQIGQDLNKMACLVQKDALKGLFETTDLERQRKYIAKETPGEFIIEYYHHKPLKECSLKEVLDAIVSVGFVSNWFDMINYTDNGDYYTLNATHSMGLNLSKVFVMMQENVFASYGAKTESHVSERSFFIKVFKNSNH